MVKREVKWLILNSLKKDDLVKLKFSKTEKENLKWEHSREFEFNGNMYDIVQSEVTPDSFTYFCYLDHAETKLNDRIDDAIKHIAGKHPQQNSTKDELSDFLKSLYCNEIEILDSSNKKVFHKSQFQYSTFELKCNSLQSSPPPEVG